MLVTRATVVCVLIAALATAASADIPETMNYQVMVTDADDQPLPGGHAFVFRIYDSPSGGLLMWEESQALVANQIGVVDAILGSAGGIGLMFDAPAWLEVEVDGEILSPRRELTSAPYAFHARHADYLDELPGESYATYEELSIGGVVNDPTNPLEWTRLKSVPAGFADGTDNVGPGDGHSLDAADGSPVDVVYVEPDGKVRIGNPIFVRDSKLSVRSSTQPAAGFMSQGLPATLFALHDGEGSVNPATTYFVMGDTVGSSWPGVPTALVAEATSGVADGGAVYFCAQGSSPTAHVENWTGSGTALYARVTGGGTGYTGHFNGGDGVYTERDSGYQTLDVSNSATGEAADAVWVYTESGAASNTWALYSRCYEGEAGRFSKYTDDDRYAAQVFGATESSEGLYVQGTLVHTGAAARWVATSRGREAVFGMHALESEVVASGSSKLAAGRARVEFDRLFVETTAGTDDIRVTATPIGAWSALYIQSIDANGFDVRADAGDTEVEFHWVAIGRAAGSESDRSITLPDPEEEARLTEQKEAENMHERTDEETSPIHHGAGIR